MKVSRTLPKERPNPPDQRRDKNRVGEKGQRFALRMKWDAAENLNRGRRKHGCRYESQESNRGWKYSRRTDENERCGPKARPGGKGWSARRQTHRRTGHNQPLADRKHDVASCHEILASAQKVHRQQRA